MNTLITTNNNTNTTRSNKGIQNSNNVAEMYSSINDDFMQQSNYIDNMTYNDNSNKTPIKSYLVPDNTVDNSSSSSNNVRQRESNSTSNNNISSSANKPKTSWLDKISNSKMFN